MDRFSGGATTIYLVNSGLTAQSNDGALDRPAAPATDNAHAERLLCEVRRWNALRGVVIHVLDLSGNGDPFLRRLAEDNGGRWLRP